MTATRARRRHAPAWRHSKRRRVKPWRAVPALAAILAVPAAFAAALLALVGAALLTSAVAVIAPTALVAGALVAGVLVRFAVRRSRWAARQLPLALAAGLVWPAVFWAVTLRAPDGTPPARPVPGQQVW